MNIFENQKLFIINDKNIEYEKISDFEGEIVKIKNRKFLFIKESLLQKLSELAFYNISHYLRSSHLLKLKNIISDKKASNNDKYVALTLLKNANTASGGILPMCQDTGTAIVLAKKGGGRRGSGTGQQSRVLYANKTGPLRWL